MGTSSVIEQGQRKLLFDSHFVTILCESVKVWILLAEGVEEMVEIFVGGDVGDFVAEFSVRSEVKTLNCSTCGGFDHTNQLSTTDSRILRSVLR